MQENLIYDYETISKNLWRPFLGMIYNWGMMFNWKDLLEAIKNNENNEEARSKVRSRETIVEVKYKKHQEFLEKQSK